MRQDIRSSFGSSTTTAQGVPLTIQLTIQDAADCTPIAGAAVYVWHCDRDGNYSLYSQAAANENYLRGVQEADANGVVTFQSIFPACYSGRWPHVHFEVYPSLDMATNENDKIATSQIALPKDVCDQVYATDGYSQSVQNAEPGVADDRHGLRRRRRRAPARHDVGLGRRRPLGRPGGPGRRLTSPVDP